MRFSSFKTFAPVAVGALLVAMTGCGGTTAFQGGQAFAIAGTPPPPPPPPAPVQEAAKPPPRVELRDNKIEIHEKIQFEQGKATIKAESFGLLKEIADTIKENPQIKKLSIEGHASAEGDAKNNMKLSDDRAKSVMKHLVDKEGIKKEMLSAKGFGEDKPIGDNNTDEGKEKNRRVEFVVTEQDVTKKKVHVDPTTGHEKVVETTKATEKKEEPAADKGDAKVDVKKAPIAVGKRPAVKPAAADKAAPAAKPEEKKK